MITSNIDRIMKEAENKAKSIDKVLSTMPLDRAPAEALRVIATELVLIRAELAGLRMTVAGTGKAAAMGRRRGLITSQKSPGDPSRVTYYVAIQFVRRPDGSLVAQRPVECAHADAAIACAKTMTQRAKRPGPSLSRAPGIQIAASLILLSCWPDLAMCQTIFRSCNDKVFRSHRFRLATPPPNSPSCNRVTSNSACLSCAHPFFCGRA